MRVIALNGSARGKKGVTWKLMDAFLKGLTEGGATVKDTQLHELNISYCTACLTCMHRTPGQCVIKDDMNQIYPYLKESDIFLMGTPVYTDTMTALMKTVMDRCICCLDPFLRIDEEDRTRHPYSWRMPAGFFLISTSGFPEKESFDPLIATYKAQTANFGSKPLGEICVPGSIALQVEPQNFEPHLDMIGQAGKMLALFGKVEPTLLEEINTPILSRQKYLQIAARYEDWCRRRRGETSSQAASGRGNPGEN
ncbi:MAG: Iron-sulfur flavoprotein [Syntrophorhabdus sp. PtaU1.Bin153]|nr:MAG: Iron-sulfur flavoprotein [Syntrophorhabdus sp. PtaU1.Bin153]